MRSLAETNSLWVVPSFYCNWSLSRPRYILNAGSIWRRRDMRGTPSWVDLVIASMLPWMQGRCSRGSDSAERINKTQIVPAMNCMLFK